MRAEHICQCCDLKSLVGLADSSFEFGSEKVGRRQVIFASESWLKKLLLRKVRAVPRVTRNSTVTQVNCRVGSMESLMQMTTGPGKWGEEPRESKKWQKTSRLEVTGGRGNCGQLWSTCPVHGTPLSPLHTVLLLVVFLMIRNSTFSSSIGNVVLYLNSPS